MAERWAALLANAAADGGRVHPSYPRILSELSPQEAGFLEHLGNDHHFFYISDELDLVAQGRNVSPSDFHHALRNLERLALVAVYPTGSGSVGDLSESDLERIERETGSRAYVDITSFGLRFLRACWPPTAA